MLRRINIFGAAGTGTSTIGRALATSLGIPHVEADDCFWLPTDPPFQQMRPPAERQAMLDATLDPQAPWVLSGSIAGWGDPIVPMLDLAVFLWVPPAIRLARLLARERERHGDAALAPGGAMHDGFRLFMSWAAAFIVFTCLPATSLTETNFTPFTSEIFKTSWNGLGYTETLALSTLDVP